MQVDPNSPPELFEVPLEVAPHVQIHHPVSLIEHTILLLYVELHTSDNQLLLVLPEAC